MTTTETTTDTRESLLAAYDEWRARRDELEATSTDAYLFVKSDDEAVELVARMGRWLRSLRTH